MSRYLTSRRLFLLLGSIIILIAVAGLTLGSTGRNASFPEKVIMDVQNTVSGWLYRPVSKITAFFGGIHNLQDMYSENAQLKQEMQNYQEVEIQLKQEQVQNSQLKTMLGWQQKVKNKLTLVPAHVTGRDPSTWNSELTIDAGSANGVQPNMAVVAPDGSLVGRVEVVARYSAKVVLITDTQLGDGVSALVQSQKGQEPFGIVVGSNKTQGELDMTFWAPLVHVQVGDTVITSGQSTIFPPNIIIGSIASVASGDQGTTKTATVTPAADLDYLQNVSVIKWTQGTSGK